MCSLKKNIGSTLCAFALVSNSVFALDIIPIESTVTIINGDQSISQKTTGISLPATKQIIAPEQVTALISYRKKVGIVSFSILSPTKSEAFIKWDNQAFMFPRFDANKVRFLRPGSTRQISFNVTKPMSGVISVFGSDKKLIKQIPYIVIKQSRFSQNLTGRVNNSDSDGVDDNQSLNLSYSIGRRAPLGQPIWRGGISYSSDLDDNDKSASLFFGVSW